GTRPGSSSRCGKRGWPSTTIWRASPGDGRASTGHYLRHRWRKSRSGPTPPTGGKNGSKRMLLVDARGVPLSIIVTAANHHDVTQLAATLDAIVAPRPPLAPRACQHLCADAGFVGATADRTMRDHDYTPHVRPRGEERAQRAHGKRARRWVVEVAHSWFTRFRKL